MEYRSAIVDELGCLVAWVSETDADDVERILDDHPEYSITCLECECDGYVNYFDDVEYYDGAF